jgi:hypothetical protein
MSALTGRERAVIVDALTERAASWRRMAARAGWRGPGFAEARAEFRRRAAEALAVAEHVRAGAS